MGGLYIHIPFCASRCIYCAFYSTTHHEWRQRYIEAVCREMQLRRSYERETVYLGGGTPSQLSAREMEMLFSSITDNFKIADDAEVTVECNPEDVTEELASSLVGLGVNRVSMGAQTFSDERLRFLRRRHTSAQVACAVRRLRKAGIENLSVDLMYGFPGQTLDDWQHDIDAALALDVEHLSAYCLTVEEGTPLYALLHRRQETPGNELTAIDEELERRMYYRLVERLTAAGYEHYEISNFARPGRRSRHNSSYWQETPYIGLGAAAHSMCKIHGEDGLTRTIRSWNVSDLRQYIEAIERGERPYEYEELDEDTEYNDRVTVALRTCEGLDLSALLPRHRAYALRTARRFIDDGLLSLDDTHLRLTRRGLFVSDMVMAELMFVSETDGKDGDDAYFRNAL